MYIYIFIYLYIYIYIFIWGKTIRWSVNVGIGITLRLISEAFLGSPLTLQTCPLQESHSSALPFADFPCDNALEVFAAVHQCAQDMAHPHAKPLWRSACRSIIAAARRAELLLQPLLWVEVFPEELGPDAAESVAFTHPTAESHPQAHLEGSVTAVTWSEPWTQGEAERVDVPEENFGGRIEAIMQDLEHKLLELKKEHGNQDHADIAATLLWLGAVSCQAGDLKGAKQQVEESLRMKRSLHGDKDHPGIAATLH